MLKRCRGTLKRAMAAIWRTNRGKSEDNARFNTPILCYHSVNDLQNSVAQPLPCKLFEEHVRYLKKNHTIISLQQYTDVHFSGATMQLPDDAVIITFDDGYSDNYTNVFPILAKHKTHATIFLVTGFLNNEVQLIDDPNWSPMTWGEAREMLQSPFVDFGVHTHTHRLIASLGQRDANMEIMSSIEIFERELNKKAQLFAYPNGQGRDISQYAMNLLKAKGIESACSTFWRSWNTPADQFTLNRIMISSSDSVLDLKDKISGHYDFIYYIHNLQAFFFSVISGKGTYKKGQRLK